VAVASGRLYAFTKESLRLAEYKQEQAAVSGFVTGTLSGCDQFFNLTGCQVFSVVVHFVYCLGVFGWPEAAKIQDSSFEQ
jgi:hypothetical protein